MARFSRILLLLLFAIRCQRSDRLFSKPGTPIILISIDTLRSDHLPAYGYTKIETPAIDTFRSDSILYERAYAHCPLTLVSHASIFTGEFPGEHGIRDNIGYQLNPKSRTIAEILKSNGYATGGAVSAVVLRGETGIKRGFDFWEDDIDIDPSLLTMGRAQRSGDETREIAQRWIDQHKSGPFFFFFHIYEPHTPYEPTYDADIVTADRIMGRFFTFLRQEGIYDRAAIILLSDHGEGLGEHGEDEHGVLLYREALQVPLIIKLPNCRQRGTAVTTPVQLIDVFPTITEALRASISSEGQSLMAALHGTVKAARPIYSETYYPRFHFGWSDLHSLISASNHYIKAPRPELYDLAGDSAERRNLAEENRRAYVALRDTIVPFIKEAAAPSAINPEQARQLAALGYIGSTISAVSGEQLADPKDHIKTSGEMRQAFNAFREQRYQEATVLLSKLLHENPKMLDLVTMQVASLAKLGRLEEAISLAKQGLHLCPTATNLALMIASLSLELERLDDAETHARLAVHDLPAESHKLLAQVWLERKDFGRAAAEANIVLGPNRDHPAGLLLLGRIAQAEGHPAAALDDFDQALRACEVRHRRPLQSINYYRGDTLARLGRPQEAEDAFRKEIELYPTDPQAYKNLVLLYVSERKNDAATQLIFAMEKAAPIPPTYVAISETLRVLGDLNGAHFWAVRGLKLFPNNKDLRNCLRS